MLYWLHALLPPKRRKVSTKPEKKNTKQTKLFTRMPFCVILYFDLTAFLLQWHIIHRQGTGGTQSRRSKYSTWFTFSKPFNNGVMGSGGKKKPGDQIFRAWDGSPDPSVTAEEIIVCASRLSSTFCVPLWCHLLFYSFRNSPKVLLKKRAPTNLITDARFGQRSKDLTGASGCAGYRMRSSCEILLRSAWIVYTGIGFLIWRRVDWTTCDARCSVVACATHWTYRIMGVSLKAQELTLRNIQCQRRQTSVETPAGKNKYFMWLC